MTMAQQQNIAVNEKAKSRYEYEHSWEPDVAKLILQRLKEREEKETPQQQRRPFMVALVGIPGGGKSVSSLILANLLEEEDQNNIVVPTMIMPHDGYHLPLEQLKQFPDSQDKIYRRGAPDTFDPHALQRDLDRIRNNSSDEDDLILVPGFDHAKGDPEPDAHAFDRNQHKVVIGEGLYLLHDKDGWQDVATYFDLSIFIDSDVDNCMERLKIRNLSIPGYTPEEIRIRVDAVDRMNAETVLKSRERADLVVESIVSKPKTKGKKKKDGSLQHARNPSMDALNLIVPSHYADEEEEVPKSIHEATESNAMMNAAVDDELPQTPYETLVGSWEKDMAQTIWERMQQTPDNHRPYMVGLVGMPGSGKSASSFLLANELEQQFGLKSMTMPHDGYHYTMDYLRTLGNSGDGDGSDNKSNDAIYRRGAPDTFDSASLLRDMERIRNSNDDEGEETIIKIPGFDHAKGDPTPDQHIFDRHQHPVVICEGLYLLHDDSGDGDENDTDGTTKGWKDIKSMLDFSIFMDSDLEVCIERVKIRNRCIPGYTPEEIVERAETVDRANAMTVLNSKHRADVVVESLAIKKKS